MHFYSLRRGDSFKWDDMDLLANLYGGPCSSAVRINGNCSNQRTRPAPLAAGRKAILEPRRVGLAATKGRTAPSMDALATSSFQAFHLVRRKIWGFSERGVGTGPTRQNTLPQAVQCQHLQPGPCLPLPRVLAAIPCSIFQLAPAGASWQRDPNGCRSDQGPGHPTAKSQSGRVSCLENSTTHIHSFPVLGQTSSHRIDLAEGTLRRRLCNWTVMGPVRPRPNHAKHFVVIERH